MKSNFQKKKTMNIRPSQMHNTTYTSPNSPTNSPLPSSGFNDSLVPPNYDNELNSQSSESSYKQLDTVYSKLGSEDAVLPALRSPRNLLSQEPRPSQGFPSSSPRLTSIPIINEESSKPTAVRKRQPRNTIDYQIMRPKKKKEIRNLGTEEESVEKPPKNSVNISEQLAGLMRVESKQQLLKRLFMEEMREREERGEEVVGFEEFQRGYDTYMIKVVGVAHPEPTPAPPRNTSIAKKSNAHLREILRSEIISQHNDSVHTAADPRHKER